MKLGRTVNRKFRECSFGVLLSMMVWLPCQADENKAAAKRWVQDKDHSVALAVGDSVAWRFSFGAEQMKPNFYPLGLPGGASLVVDRPADHPWHHGFWFSWKFINGVNFWEPDAKTGRPAGRTNWSDVDVTTRPDWSAHIAMKLLYSASDSEPLLTEDRTTDLGAPDATGQYAIDWQSIFRAGKSEVKLACVPIPPAKDGVRWGGYAGLSIRFAKELLEREANSAEGPIKFEDGIYRGQSTAMDYSGTRGNQPAGIAVLDHPSNPRHPADWYLIKTEMSYINAALLSKQPLVLKPGELLTLRYRVIVHPGRWDSMQLQKEYQKFAQP